MSMPALDDGTLEELQQWLFAVPFSRNRKSLARDFSDGILVAELIAHFLPRYVDLNNFTAANSIALKRYNWETLNKQVLQHLNYQVPDHQIQQIVSCRAGAIEFVLLNLRLKIDLAISQQRFRPSTRYRSRSASRAGSTLSLNNMSLSEYDAASSKSVSTADTTTSGSASARSTPKIPREATMNIYRFAVSTPSAAREQLCEDLVPARLLHQAQQDILSKEEQLQTMFSRIKHLERLVLLKDERIEQLTQRLDRLAQVFYQHQAKNQKAAEEAAIAKKNNSYFHGNATVENSKNGSAVIEKENISND